MYFIVIIQGKLFYIKGDIAVIFVLVILQKQANSSLFLPPEAFAKIIFAYS